MISRGLKERTTARFSSRCCCGGVSDSNRPQRLRNQILSLIRASGRPSVTVRPTQALEEVRYMSLTLPNYNRAGGRNNLARSNPAAAHKGGGDVGQRNRAVGVNVPRPPG